jgi:hypothetical protein
MDIKINGFINANSRLDPISIGNILTYSYIYIKNGSEKLITVSFKSLI